MIPKTSKFPLRTEFLTFRETARQFATPHLRILWNTTYPVRDSRLSVIVPKKVSKLATTRNYLKRLTYDTLYPLIQDQKLNCVVVYKPLPLKKSPATQKELINELTQTTRNL